MATDPCMGSGHILVYAFDLLMRIYDRMGWTKRDAVKSIVERNLYGLDIDQRAAQLAYFAVMMKACEYDSRFLTRRDAPPQPNVYMVTESNGISDSAVFYFAGGRPELARDLQMVMEDMRDASEYGSILTPRSVDFDALYDRVDETYDEFSLDRDEVWERILPMLRSAQLLSQKYDVVVTNPPYMGAGNMNGTLLELIKKNYPNEKADLFACFIRKCNEMIKPNCFASLVTMQSWMFLSSFEKMRTQLFSTKNITNLMHMENMVMGIAFGTAVTVFQNCHVKGYKGTYNHIKLSDIEDGVPKLFPVPGNRFAQISTDNFSKIPGSPVAYWVNEQFISNFTNPTLGKVSKPRSGLSTNDNDRFLRYWYEIDRGKMCIDCPNIETVVNKTEKWFPYNKGGQAIKWYGNFDYVVNWENDGEEIKYFATHNPKDPKTKHWTRRASNYQLYFNRAITWSLTNSSRFAARLRPAGSIFDMNGMSLFCKHDDELYILALLCSKSAEYYMNVLNPTIANQAGDIAKIPFIKDDKAVSHISALSKECVDISKNDWDSFEISWDFQHHSLIRNVPTVQEAYEAWARECEERVRQLKSNEEELNRIFIHIYGLQDELTPEVEDRDVTVRRADLGRDIRSLVSYAVGCMFGRYSLDTPGLAFAGGDFDSVYKLEPDVLVDEHGNPILIGGLTILSGSSYKEINVNGKWRPVSFEPDKDNCLPITDEEYFEDDIVARFVDFVRVVFGEETLEENLDYIAKALGNRGSTSREVIRNYFLNDFMADHLKIYQKRPIYWMFDSGKQNGFKALVYMHRWNADTTGNVRVEYLHKTQRVYERELDRMQEVIDNSKVNREIAQAQKRRDKLTRQLKETRDYDQRLAHLALLRINIDLDDGVKDNYDKVQTADGKNMEILAKIR